MNLLSTIKHHLHGGTLRAAIEPLWADVDTLVDVLVLDEEIVLELHICNPHPINRVQIAELWVLLDADGTTHNLRQAPQAKLLHVRHLKRHEGIVEEQRLAPYHS